MGYQAEGVSTKRAQLGIKLREQQKDAEAALTDYQLAKKDEANAKNKRNIWGKVLGVVVAGAAAAIGGPAAFLGGDLWTYALGYGLGGQVGNVAYDQDWLEGAGGEHHMAMENTLDSIKVLEEESQFASIREELDKNIDLHEMEIEDFETTGAEFFTDTTSDFLTTWATLAALEGGSKTLSDAFTT